MSRGLFFARGGKKPMLRGAAKLRTKFSHGHDQKTFPETSLSNSSPEGRRLLVIERVHRGSLSILKFTFFGTHCMCEISIAPAAIWYRQGVSSWEGGNYAPWWHN